MHILLSKYGCHISYVSHTTKIQNGHIDQTFYNMCAKAQPTAIHASQVIAKYFPGTNIPIKLGIYAIYAKYLTDLYGRCVHIYMPHMK